MFVNPISNFNFSNAKLSALRNNDGSEKPQPAEPAPQPDAPKLQAQLSRDTVSFGEKDKKVNGMKALPIAIALASAAGGVVSCTPDYESNTSLSSSTTINLKDYHKCGCDSFPIVIPGGRDTVYIPVPGETVHDTIYVEKPGEVIRDTIYIDNPPDTVIVEKPVYDTIYVDRPVYDTIYVDRPVHDTIWIKPDTVYIPRKPHFEINDSINKDIEDFDIPTEGDGDFVYAMQGRNEYLGAQHLLVFNGFFSNEHKSSFVDHAFEEDDIPAGGDKPSKYYYTRYDISSDYVNGRRFVEMYVPRKSRHILPNDKETGSAGWEYAGSFYVKNASVAETAKLIANDMDGTVKAQYTKNEKRGPGNIYKEWPNDAGEMPKTTIQKVKAYRKDLDKLD